MKDSTAIYSLSIVISVTKQRKKLNVATELNNEQVRSFFVGTEALKKLDYNKLMKGRKESKFVVSAYILVYGSRSDRVVKLSDVPAALKFLFVQNQADQENLGTVLLEVDKKVYH
ncbi:hypothetical protein [Pedobacter sp. SYP-B3415]|uniref:hypothetical protein n=1 Tax=Pedobacter sp. SYP-B3415 TaxID=2496641 RepID=UPI00101C0297|nr:hypothetical protein [Pedobacter sp. SYP-B3415]